MLLVFLLSVLLFRVTSIQAESGGIESASVLEETVNYRIFHQAGKISIIPSLNHQPLIKNAVCAVLLDNRWLYSHRYPSVSIDKKPLKSPYKNGTELVLTYSGLPDRPNLIWRIRGYDDQPELIFQVEVINQLPESNFIFSGFKVLSARESISAGGLFWKGAARFRVLSESITNTVSRDRTLFLSPETPRINSNWIQLITPADRQGSFLAACLEAHRFLTTIKTDYRAIKRSGVPPKSAAMNWEVANGGIFTRSGEKAVQLQLPLSPGEKITSESIILDWGISGIDTLEDYGQTFQKWNSISIPPNAPMGYCTWTAHYREVDERKCLADARQMIRIFKPSGYNFFQVDGLSWPTFRGDYLDTNRTLFPRGMEWLGKRITKMGLIFGIWLGPGEVSEKSKLFRNHPSWLVRDTFGHYLPGRYIPELKEKSYLLDMTSPAVLEHLKTIFSILYQKYSCRYFKLDFLNITAREGRRFRTDITGIESLRNGLATIRKVLGPGAFTTAAAAPTWAVAGLVDACRAGPDIAHDWNEIKASADAIASRFYLHRRFFILDPDAMVVAPKSCPGEIPGRDQPTRPITLEEARVSVTIAILTGGTLQLGDNLQELMKYPKRLALVNNPELIKINRRGKIARPIDLMDYTTESAIPAFWHIHEDENSEILAIFNWGEEPEEFNLNPEKIGLLSSRNYIMRDLWDGMHAPIKFRGNITTDKIPPHSVMVWEIRPLEKSPPEIL